MKPRVSNCAIAQNAGISERHLYRLRKKHTPDTGSAALDITRERVAGQILIRLGRWELIGTPTERYLDDFIRELVALLHTQVRDDEIDIDRRWAKGNALQVVEIVRNASERRRDKLRSDLDAGV